MITQNLTVELAFDVVTVTGTVNNVETSWYMQSPSVWESVVPRSNTGEYRVAITAWDELGRSTTFETVLYYGFAAVIDRGPGSYYNATDLNRVGYAVRFLADLFGKYGYSVVVNAKTDWEATDIPNQKDMKIYLEDIQLLKERYAVFPTTPELPDSIRHLGYQGANAIEHLLVDMYLLIQNMIAGLNQYVGQFYAGGYVI